MRAVPVLILALVSVASSQEKPLPQTDRPVSVDQQRSTGTLPSFDLPEFVITGRESIDLPVAEKKNISMDVSGRGILRPSVPGVVRENPDIVGGAVQRVRTVDPGQRNIRGYLGLGSFSSLLAGVQASGVVEDLHLQGDAEYSSTAGFAPNTSGNHGHVNAGVRAPTSLLGSFVESERISFQGGFARSAYQWYGSQQPGNSRALSTGFGGLGMHGFFPSGSNGALQISYAGGSVTDTSATVREGIFGLRGEFSGRFFELPMTFHTRASGGGKSGGSGGAYSGFEAGARTDWSPIPFLETSISAALATISGEGGQQKVMFLPGFSASFAINQQHRFVGRYATGIQMQSLLSLIEAIPFLDGSQPVRHSLMNNKGVISVESEWTQDIRSSVSLESSKWSDYPVVADTSKAGVFRLFYGDITETLLRLSVVAKLPANHYFSAIAILRSSKGSTSGLSVPYLPSSELRLSYRKAITDQLEAEATIQVVSARESALAGVSTRLSGYTRADVQVSYGVLERLKVWAGVRNLLDADIEHWASYPETPFALNIGLSYTL